MKPAPFDWSIPEVARKDVVPLAKELGLPHVLAQLLALRGITTPEAGRKFLDPLSGGFSDPFAMEGMKQAAERLEQARHRKELVHVFGDYDADGISGTAVLVRGLRRFGLDNCTYSTPHRLKEGYGLSPARVEQAAADGVKVLITVDNGIKDYKAAQEAKARGIDLIITDHHSIEGPLPEAMAVINPRRDSPEAPTANASGSAVAFKLCSALNGGHHDAGLAALGVVADIVPLLQENRLLVATGLKELATAPPPGVAALAEVAGVSMGSLSAENIAFQLGPRINASGRVGSGRSGLELLLTDSDDEARNLASDLNAANDERRVIERNIYEDAAEQLEAKSSDGRQSICLAKTSWHPGVVGIVASKLQHLYARPVVLISIGSDGLARASARAPRGFDLVSALSACHELLERYGGHAAAAGLAIQESNIEAFEEAFEKQSCAQMAESPPSRPLDIDTLVALSEIDGHLLRSLERLEPIGKGNPAPVFCALDVEVLPGSVHELRGGHIRCTVRQGPAQFAVIAFNLAAEMAPSAIPDRADIAFTPKFNEWRGRTTIQLQLKAIRPAETTP